MPKLTNNWILSFTPACRRCRDTSVDDDEDNESTRSRHSKVRRDRVTQVVANS